MSRPLVVTDCDEVLLHMVRHFRDWLGEAHGIEFPLDSNPFASNGSSAMCRTVRATSATSITGSGTTEPSACSAPRCIAAVMSVAALPMSI